MQIRTPYSTARASLLVAAALLSVLLLMNAWAEPSSSTSRLDAPRLAGTDYADVFSGPVTVRQVEGGLLITLDAWNDRVQQAEFKTYFFMADTVRSTTALAQNLYDPQGTVVHKAKMLELVLPDTGLMLRLGLAIPDPEEFSRIGLAPSAYLQRWNEEQRETAKNRYEVTSIIEIENGYELSFNTTDQRPTAEEITRLTDASLTDDVVPIFRGLFHDYPDFPGGDGNTCQAGGTGSTSCTIGSGGNTCTATCGTGYYACCNLSPLSCRCYRNP